MTAYYNEFDPFAAQWLRKLIDAGLIAPGVVDDRSITDVTPSDLKGFTQCHFFAGIGGWSYALRLATVPDFFPCWTGSPPCQPFSTAGNQLGQLDERHLAPAFMRLVAQCRPAVLFGEQVAAAIGKHWLDDLFIELENENYTCGAAVLPACGVGAPHSRDRLFFGAAMDYSNNAGAQGHGRFEPVIFPQGRENEKRHALSSDVAARLWSGWKADTGADGTTRSLPAGFGTPAYGLSTRVGRLRGYGNAIAPHVAAEFITAFMAASTEAAA